MEDKSKALEYAKEITVAVLMNNVEIFPNNSTGVQVANFFEAVYNKIAELEK